MIRASQTRHPDTIQRFFQFSLLGLLASGYLAVAGSGYLDLVTTVAVGAAIITRGFLLAADRALPLSERAITVLTIVYIGFYPLDYLFLSGEFLPATVHLVLFLAVVKILTAHSDRDHLLVVVIAFLELLAASLLSSNLNYFAFLALFLLFGVCTLASWEIRKAARGGEVVHRPGDNALSWRLSGLSLVICAGVLLITTGLFFLLPRTARAAFERLVPERFHITAFSNQVTLGEIGEVKQQSTVLMHVRIPGVDSDLHLKWRGAALGEFDGKRWFNREDGGVPLRVEKNLLRLADDNQRRRVGRRLNYEVQLKSFASDALFVAGLPEFIRTNERMIIRTPGDGFRFAYRGGGVLRYGVYAYLEDSAPEASAPVEPLADDVRAGYLALPPIDGRVAQLARRLIAYQNEPLARARAIERHLRGQYAYTIELPESEQHDPIAHFLFERRKGHCEYFASSMAVMLRSIGIPSRVATGFQSGYYNPISGWHVIRASDAHSWVEAFLPDRGWTTFDPTPPDPTRSSPGLLTRLTLLFDAADTFWQEWVLDYDLNRQIFLASRMERSSRRFSFGWLSDTSAAWKELRGDLASGLQRYGPATLAAIVLLAALLPLVFKLRKWWFGRERLRRIELGQAEATDATLMYRRALDLLARSGIEKPAWITPGEFARLIPAPATAALVGELTSAYNELRFGARPEAASRMVQSLDQLESHLSHQ